MSVTFSPQLEVVGYRLVCGFDATVFADPSQAPSHPLSGGCDAAREFLAVAKTDGWAKAHELFGEPANERNADVQGCLNWHDNGLGLSRVFRDDVEVQMANSNAQRLFEVLGLDGDAWSGSMDADEFLGRVLAGLALYAGDVGRPSEVVRGERGATVIYSEVEPGYVDAKLEQLREVANAAKARNVPVTWG